jgi:SAM-dependent methyltransferase
VFEDLTTLARLRPGSRVLELGCGTGQATVPLATRGFEVLAVELGAGLADVARRKLAAFPAVEIINAAFEEWSLPLAPFDAVVAATSFHWLDAEVRLAKVADALRPGGALALIATHHVAGGDGPFFAEVQPLLRAVDARHGRGPPAPRRRRCAALRR